MATFRNRSGRWQAAIVLRGVRASKTFRLKSEAKAWAALVESQILAGSYGKPQAGSFGDVMRRYADEVSPTKRGVRWERIRIEAFCRDPIAEVPIGSLTPAMLGEWRDRRLAVNQAGSVLRDMTLLSSVLEHARREWRMIASNPLRDVRKPSAPRPRDRLPQDAEIDRICFALGYGGDEVDSLSAQVAVMFLLAVETGMRAGEIAALRWADVDTTRRVVRLTMTKNGDSREVPLSSRAVELLDELRGIDPVRCVTVAPASRDALFRKAAKRAGCADLHFHDSRALACTRLSKVLDLYQLARVLGLRDLRTLRVYYRETAEDIARMLP